MNHYLNYLYFWIFVCLLIQTNTRKKVEEMELRIREENHVLTARIEENSFLNERIRHIKQLYQENLNLIQNN